MNWCAEAPVARPRIFLSQPLEAQAQQLLAAWADLVLGTEIAPADRLSVLAACDGAVTMVSDRLDAAAFETLRASRLKIVANYAVGYDNLDLPAATAAGIWLSNTPDVLSQATAEMAWALLLSLARRVPEGDQLVRAGQWCGWSPDQLLGHTISGKTLGLIGAGRIGQCMAALSQGFGLNILYFSRQLRPDFEARYQARWLPLDDLLRQCDLLSLHLPGGDETHHLLNAERLALLQPHCLLVNTGRGTSIDEAALVTALQQGRLAGAALDVYEFEPAVSAALRALPNVVLTPHLGSATHEARRAMARCCLNNLQAVWQGLPPPQALNQPLPL
ncbi:MAG: D-glycerate dehydrogenase [Candidatus Sericytochromatia bacterium]|nr:D-glycerate dehydrogenase [Candidatus Sericytochromatia bacterium]